MPILIFSFFFLLMGLYLTNIILFNNSNFHDFLFVISLKINGFFIVFKNLIIKLMQNKTGQIFFTVY